MTQINSENFIQHDEVVKSALEKFIEELNAAEQESAGVNDPVADNLITCISGGRIVASKPRSLLIEGFEIYVALCGTLIPKRDRGLNSTTTTRTNIIEIRNLGMEVLRSAEDANYPQNNKSSYKLPEETLIPKTLFEKQFNTIDEQLAKISSQLESMDESNRKDHSKIIQFNILSFFITHTQFDIRTAINVINKDFIDFSQLGRTVRSAGELIKSFKATIEDLSFNVSGWVKESVEPLSSGIRKVIQPMRSVIEYVKKHGITKEKKTATDISFSPLLSSYYMGENVLEDMFKDAISLAGVHKNDLNEIKKSIQEASRKIIQLDSPKTASSTVQMFKQALDDTPAECVDLRIFLSGMYAHSLFIVGLLDTALKHMLEYSKKIPSTSYMNNIYYLNNSAYLYVYQRKYGEAESFFVKALEIIQKSSGKDHPNYATLLNNLAELYRDQGLYDKAEPLYQEALEIIETSLGKSHHDYVALLNNLAELYRDQGLYDKAEATLKEALEIRKKALGENHPLYVAFLNNLGTLYKAQGLYDKAEPLFKEALEITEKSLGKDHPSYATMLNNLAALYKDQGLYDKAEPLYQEALEIKEKSLGKDHPSYANSLNNLAGLYQTQGLYDKAEPLYQEALEITEKSLGKDHPITQRVRENLILLQNIIKNK